MSVLRTLLIRREAGIFVMIVLFCLAVGLYKPQFLTLNSLRIILLLVPLILIGAMGQMLVIVARHVDLSIGSILGFSAMLTGMMFKFHPEIWWPLGFVVAIGTGTILGLINGVLVTLFRLPAIIAAETADAHVARHGQRDELSAVHRPSGCPAWCSVVWNCSPPMPIWPGAMAG